MNNTNKKYCKYCQKEIEKGKFCDTACKSQFYDKKRRRIYLTVTEKEYSKVKEEADQHNMNIATLGKYRLLNKSTPVEKLKGSKEAIKVKGELGKIGSNINQIARQLNKLNYDNNISDIDYNELKDQLQNNLNMLYELSEKIEKSE